MVCVVAALLSCSDDAPEPARPVDPQRTEARLERLQKRASEAIEQDRAHVVLPDARAFLADHPDSPDGMVLVAQLLLSQREFDEAYSLLQNALERRPAQAKVHMLAGTVAYGDERVGDAIGHYRRAVELEPDSVNHRLHLAQAFLESQQYDAAGGVLREAIRLNSSSVQAHSLLGDVHAAQEQWDEAIDAVRRAMSLLDDDPTQRVVLTQKLARLMREKFEPRESLLLLQSVRNPVEPNPTVLRDLAASWMMLGRPDAAAEEYEKALELEPMNWRFVALAATWRYRAGDEAKARAHLNQLRQLNPHSPVIAELEKKLDD